jgi:hypothetical protein
MENVSTMTIIQDDGRQAALTWLRGVLTSALEVSPLSYHQKKETTRLLSRIPDWFMASWAESLNIEYIGGRARCPDMAEQVRSEAGRDIAERYLEAHDAVPAGFCLDRLARSVIKHVQGGKLPVDVDMVEKQVCALALSEYTTEGIEFAGKAREILSDPENPNHILVDYQIALERGEKDKLEELDAILSGGRYGEWVARRLTEARRFLGLEPPYFTIKVGERTPQWDLLWKRLFTGGDE